MDTSVLKAREAPDRLKVWKGKCEGLRLRAERMAERVFLTLLWVRIPKDEPWGKAKRGALEGRGKTEKRLRR